MKKKNKWNWKKTTSCVDYLSLFRSKMARKYEGFNAKSVRRMRKGLQNFEVKDEFLIPKIMEFKRDIYAIIRLRINLLFIKD